MPFVSHSQNTIQVFEYQTIRVGDMVNGIRFEETAFRALAIYQEKQAVKYYSLVYNGVKFSHYVGIIQIGILTIEILPKADKVDLADKGRWQQVLIEMLRYCQLLKIEAFGYGQVQLTPNNILVLYLNRLLDQIKQLLNKGLPKKYLSNTENLKVLKGRLDLPKHLRKNLLHPERFYVNYQTYKTNHLFNQVLYEVLKVLQKIRLNPSLKLKLNWVYDCFPKQTNYLVQPKDFEALFAQQKYKPYSELLELSRLILFNFSPDIQGGKHHLFALLFDMNKLFEEYVFWQLKRLESVDFKVQRHTSKPFWQRRVIRPDLLIEIKGKKIILDTKWKIMKNVSPNMEDLKQMYIYCQYFGADQAILLYPDVFQIPNSKMTPFQPTHTIHKPINTQVVFLKIVDESGKLNKNLGANLLPTLT